MQGQLLLFKRLTPSGFPSGRDQESFCSMNQLKSTSGDQAAAFDQDHGASTEALAH
jgi:hypothetical protein